MTGLLRWRPWLLPVMGVAVMDVLRGLNADATTIAVITHNPEIAASMPRQVEIRDGMIVCDSEGGRP